MKDFIHSVYSDGIEYLLLVRSDPSHISDLIRVDIWVCLESSLKKDLNQNKLFLAEVSHSILKDSEPDVWNVSYKKYDDWLTAMEESREYINSLRKRAGSLLSIIDTSGGINSDKITELINEKSTKTVILHTTQFTTLRDLNRLYVLGNNIDTLTSRKSKEFYEHLREVTVSDLDIQTLISQGLSSILDFRSKLDDEEKKKMYFTYLVASQLFKDLSNPAGMVSLTTTWENISYLAGIIDGSVTTKEFNRHEWLVVGSIPNDVPFPEARFSE